MKFKSFFQAIGVTFVAAGLASQVLADPVTVGPPVVVDGKMAPYSLVKKSGQIWYPASVVGYERGINFSYDHGSRTLFANGVETQIEAIVVDDIVYVNLTPKVTQHDMRPGMNTLALRQAELRQMESASPHLEGYTDALLMSENVSSHPHPWTSGPDLGQLPIIDLDPTAEEPVAPHMQPGARPPEAPPARLPNRLPDSNEPAYSAAQPGGAVEVPYSPGAGNGIPLQVSAHGGPEDGSVANLTPVRNTEPVKSAAPFTNSGLLNQSQGENSVFRVKILKGDWQVTPKDRILHVKLEQTNRSKVAQANLGSFAVRCEDGSRVEASRTRSYLPENALSPGAGRTGELVFRLSAGQVPQSLELEGALQLALPLTLQ